MYNSQNDPSIFATTSYNVVAYPIHYDEKQPSAPSITYNYEHSIENEEKSDDKFEITCDTIITKKFDNYIKKNINKINLYDIMCESVMKNINQTHLKMIINNTSIDDINNITRYGLNFIHIIC